ncbi:MAG: HEPN domain-containing protein [Deltaproteobacteria bacterium]|nr:HEPN domain-containing protein [Deltaproteobacteria bacterium]
MKDAERLNTIISYWIIKSQESLEAAGDELKAGRLSFSVNRIYYACFYMITAVLLQENLHFKKHSGLRAAFHQNLVKTDKVSREHGKLFDELFEARQRGDYFELVFFERPMVEYWLNRAQDFINDVKSLLRIAS